MLHAARPSVKNFDIRVAEQTGQTDLTSCQQSEKAIIINKLMYNLLVMQRLDRPTAL